MATVTIPVRSRNLAEAQQRVRSPLERLRSYIRLYVSLEGAALVGTYLALWFWVGLIFDYGFFRAFHIDWVQALPLFLRSSVLGCWLIGLPVVLAGRIIWRQFWRQEDILGPLIWLISLGFFLAIYFLVWVVAGILMGIGWGLAGGIVAGGGACLAAGLWAVVLIPRLLHPFQDRALALVLERRFPKILGDRLITAVELADPKKAADIGYSAAMIQETIHEAAQRVEQLKINEVFDWERLTRRGIVVGLLVLGGYLAMGSVFCTANAIQGHGFTAAGFGQFHEVAGIWFERNILLQNVIWPRMAHLELIDFPDSGEVRIGRGERAPTIRVRALKYVIAGAPTRQAVESYRGWLEARQVSGDELEGLVGQFGKKPPEGWRALSWFDLTPELLGASVPEVALPADWKVRNLAAGLTIDEIELNLDKTETHKTLSADAQESLRNVLELIDGRATDPAMSRTLRRLLIPDEALLVYKGNTTSSQTTMQKLADNEYTGQFGDLKETVTFYVQGLDYYTASRKIVVVEPPALEELTREEERPAYLYYRLKRDDSGAELSGKKQRFEAANVSLQGGEVSRIDVPIGSNLVLTARASKDLRSATIVAHKAQKAGIPIAASPVEKLDERTFRTRFQNVRFEQNFLFRFTDTDGVTGQRQVVVIPTEDAPPKIRELAPDDIVRKVQGGYMVAVGARIPFKGQVDDDRGLTDVRYAYTISLLESARINRRVGWPVLGVASLVPTGQGPLPGLMDLAVTLKEAAKKTETKTEAAPVRRYSLPLFEQRLRDRPDDKVLHPDEIRGLLAQAQKEPYRALLRNFAIKADEWRQPDLDPVACDLPLWKTNPELKNTDVLRAQPRYQMQLWLEAVDTDLDSDKGKDGKPQPHLKVSEEKFTFFVVSENELLTEIAKEEEKLSGDFETMYQRVLEAQSKLVQTNLDLSSTALKVEDLGPTSVRADQVNEVLEKSQNATREVHAAYARILREVKTNQVDRRIIDRVENTIVKPLADVDGAFDKMRDRVTAFRKALDNPETAPVERIALSRKAGDTAKVQMQDLARDLEKILGAMAKLTDINRLIKILTEIDASEQGQYDLIKEIHRKLEDELFDKASGGTKPDKKKPDDKK